MSSSVVLEPPSLAMHWRGKQSPHWFLELTDSVSQGFPKGVCSSIIWRCRGLKLESSSVWFYSASFIGQAENLFPLTAFLDTLLSLYTNVQHNSGADSTDHWNAELLQVHVSPCTFCTFLFNHFLMARLALGCWWPALWHIQNLYLLVLQEFCRGMIEHPK